VKPTELWIRYFWLACLAVCFFNFLMDERAAASVDPHGAGNSDEAKKLRRRVWMVSSVPWVVMGIGSVIGGVPDVWHYLRPQGRNPYVIAWFASLLVVAVTAACWVLLRGGAEKIVAYKLIRSRGLTLKIGRIKLFAALAPVWILLWTTFLFHSGPSLSH
jgi:hypothetical protein